jgi:glutamine---fructose-6-phosphate transaminase (isomerizing)
MSTIEAEIRSTPAIVRRTYARVAAQQDGLRGFFEGPVVLLGCGTSYCVGLAAAASFEAARGIPAQAQLASEYLPRRGWTVVAISRTGQTTELVRALQAARTVDARVMLIAGEAGSAAAGYADAVLPIEFAAEPGVVQTRFVTASVVALQALMLGEAGSGGDLAARMEQSLAVFDPTPLVGFDHVVFLGRGPRYGLACAAALNLQETTLLVPEAHQTLDYRHGPIAAADARTLVWAFDAAEDAESGAVLADVRATGATVYAGPGDPLILLVQAQLTALYKARTRDLDPTSPRHLTRAIVL